MTVHPVESIETAELQAEQVVLKASNEKMRRIREAEELASQESARSMNAAEAKAEEILSFARIESQKSQKDGLEVLEKELLRLEESGTAKKEQAVAAVVDLLTTLL